MAELLQTCPHNPCPICGDISGRCQIDEYGYISFCYLRLDTKVGDLSETWLCYRIFDDCSQWKDQRIALETQYQQKKIRIVDGNGQPLDFTALLGKSLKKHRERGGGA